MKKPRRYAEGTEVSVEKSKAEIERTLRRFGADAFSTGFEGRRAFIAFRARDRFIRFSITLPEAADEAVRQMATRKHSSQDQALYAEEQRRWRALVLLVKAKMAAIEEGIVEFEQEFFSHVVLRSGRTVYEEAHESVAIEYKTGTPQRLLPGAPG